MRRALYLLRTSRDLLLSAAAFVWRRLMFRTTFIAVTGSVGKTTSTTCLGTILTAHFPTNWTPGGANGRLALARNVLRTRLTHRFTVIEVGTNLPGALWRASWTIDPDIAVVLKVEHGHSHNFATLDDVAAEKAQLLRRLGPKRLAILNADDPRVAAMASRLRGSVRTFGCAPGSYLRASEVSARWPARLSFRAHLGEESCRVETQLLGEHTLYPVLAALTVAVCCGVPLENAARAVAQVQPVPGRMSEATLPNGAVFLCDEYNPSMTSLEASLRVLREAETPRRILVMGDVVDTGLTVRPRLRAMGRLAAGSADMAVFLGREASVSAKTAVQSGMQPQAAHAFAGVREAAEFLRSELRPGDLVLLRGWLERHTERAFLAQVASVTCWKERCGKHIHCADCPELKRVPPSDAADRPGGGMC